MLTTTDLTFSYGAVSVLRGLTMEFPSAQVTCVIGRNGVGKTTLMRNIMGTLKSTGGKIQIESEDVSGSPPHVRAKRGISLVPQGRQIFPRMTVLENLQVGLQARTDGSKIIPEEIYTLFPILKDFLKRMGGDLSGGQQQQLAIARALVGGPKVLLLDEPTEGIQPNIIQQIGHVLQMLVKERGMTVILVEQYLDFVREFGQSFYIMNRGRVVYSGETAALTPEVVNEHLSV